MKATDLLIKLRDTARSLSQTETFEPQQQNYKFCARLCDQLSRIVNPDAALSKEQAEFVELTLSDVGNKFLPGRDVKYKETPTTCPFLLMQLATFINSCK